MINKCSVEQCEDKYECKGYCRKHYYRWKRYGDPLLGAASRGAYRAGYINKDGYRMLSINNRKISEHQYIMELHLSRKLRPGENVHHINGVRDDNRVENLELWSKNQPAGQRVSDKVAWAKEILALYEPESLAS